MASTNLEKNLQKIFSVTLSSKKTNRTYFSLCRDLLIKIKRKIKNEEEITPKKYIPLDENSENKIVRIEEKPTALKENKPLNSSTSLAFRSSLCLENENDSPVKGFISRSLIMDFNPEICLKHRDSVMEGEISNEVEDDDEH